MPQAESFRINSRSEMHEEANKSNDHEIFVSLSPENFLSVLVLKKTKLSVKAQITAV